MQDMAKLLAEYKDLQRMKKEIEQCLEALRADIQSGMACGDKIAIGGYKVSWSMIRITSVDQKILKERFPDIAAQCMSTREQERFTIT